MTPSDYDRILSIDIAANADESVPARDVIFLLGRLREAQAEIDTMKESLMKFFHAVEKLVEDADVLAELEVELEPEGNGETDDPETTSAENATR